MHTLISHINRYPLLPEFLDSFLEPPFPIENQTVPDHGWFSNVNEAIQALDSSDTPFLNDWKKLTKPIDDDKHNND